MMLRPGSAEQYILVILDRQTKLPIASGSVALRSGTVMPQSRKSPTEQNLGTSHVPSIMYSHGSAEQAPSRYQQAPSSAGCVAIGSSPGADVGKSIPSPGADVAGCSPVPVQMWEG